jgi:hypothetical protein
MLVSKKSKLIGEYIYMLGQFIKQLKSYGDFDLAQVVRTERLSVLHNLDNPYRFSNFLESWESWGCPQTNDENFIYFRNRFIGFDDYLDMQEDLYREGLSL